MVIREIRGFIEIMKIADIVGARPQFIKVAPVLRAIQRHNKTHPENPIQEVLVHTGQHYDYEMSGVFFDDLGLKPPDYHLGVGSGTHGYQTGEMLKRIEEVLLAEKPDVVMVYGDTNSTLAGALAAAKLRIPVAHVEAGLRSFNKRMAEEINRVLTDHISDLLFCPTQTAVENLRREGITQGVYLVGDVMYDAALQYLALAEQKSRILERLGLRPKEYALATVHRAENADDPQRLRAIFAGLEAIAQAGLLVILPLHPRTRKQAEALGLSPNGVRVLEPVSYLDMLLLEKNARVILTDSGGVQKEAFFFRVPCVTLREETEWVETVETGWNVLVGCDPERIVQAAQRASRGIKDTWPLGEGRTAERIISLVSGGSFYAKL
ncbi:MAG: UDP-N-acetylglucosamine 2-epimerase (non-hydrolyzing) [Candidatus Methanomethylicaceae archaeon]